MRPSEKSKSLLRVPADLNITLSDTVGGWGWDLRGIMDEEICGSVI